MSLHLAHSWRTERDDGYWYYQWCPKCGTRRLKKKEGTLPASQPPNPEWMKGGKLPTPIGE